MSSPRSTRPRRSARGVGEDIIDLGMGNPDSPDAAAHRRQAGRGGAGPAHASLLGQQGHPRSAARARRLLSAALRRRAGPGDRGDRDAGLQGGAGQPGVGDHHARRHDPGAQPVLSHPPVRLHHRRRRGAFRACHAGRGHAARPGSRGAAFGAEADRPDRQFPFEPDSVSRGPRLLSRDRRVRPPARDLDHVRPCLRGDLFRRPGPAVDSAGARREGHRGRVHQPVEDLLDAGLAHGFCRRQSAADQRADADEVVSRLRRLHADPGRCRGRAERAAGLRGSDPRAVPRTPRRADPRAGVGGVGRAEPGGVDVRLGADPAAFFRSRQRRVLQAAAGARQGRGVAGPRFRRARRGLRPHRAGGEHASAAPGGAQHPRVHAGGLEPGRTGPRARLRHEPSTLCRRRRPGHCRRRRPEAAARQRRHRRRARRHGRSR